MSLTSRYQFEKTFQRIRQSAWSYLFILPMFILFIGFTLYPLVASFRYTLYNWDGIGLPEKYIGFQNYASIIKDAYFWNAFKHTFIYSLFVVPIQLILALILASILNLNWLRVRRFFRFVFITPLVTSAAIIGILFTILITTAGKDLNQFLLHVGLLDQPVDMLGESGTAMAMIILVGIWIGLGYPLIIFTAAIQSIDRELFDAARVDGAGDFICFLRITIPLILPIILLVFLITTMHSLRVFDIIQVMTRGGPYFATDVIGTYIFRQAFFITPYGDSASKLGYASAAAFFIGIITMGITLIQYIVIRRMAEVRKRA